VVGWMNDLQNMNINDLKQWYKKWYVPNNATVVVISDKAPQKILSLIKEKFSSIPHKQLPQRKPKRELSGLGEKEVSVTPEVTANVPMLMMGYSTPSLITVTEDNKWQPYALEVMTGILSGGSSARLPKELVRGKQSAIEASASYDMYDRYDTQFNLFGVVKQSSQVSLLKKDLLTQVQRLQNYLVSLSELNRIKNQVIAANIYAKDSIFGQAMELGMLSTIGLSPQAGIDYVENIKAVTPKQIQEVAQLFLNAKNLTSAVLVPNQGLVKQTSK
jgi:zinc protease